MAEPTTSRTLVNDALKEQVLEHLGDPATVAAELEQFQDLAIRLDAEHANLLRLYPDQWVAMNKDGSIVAKADTVDGLFQQLDEKQIPYDDVVHDYLDSNPRSLLL